MKASGRRGSMVLRSRVLVQTQQNYRFKISAPTESNWLSSSTPSASSVSVLRLGQLLKLLRWFQDANKQSNCRLLRFLLASQHSSLLCWGVRKPRRCVLFTFQCAALHWPIYCWWQYTMKLFAQRIAWRHSNQQHICSDCNTVHDDGTFIIFIHEYETLFLSLHSAPRSLHGLFWHTSLRCHDVLLHIRLQLPNHYAAQRHLCIPPSIHHWSSFSR